MRCQPLRWALHFKEAHLSCHLQVGRSKEVAFVFSCPGRYEEVAGEPAAKVTGKNLSNLLGKLGIALNKSGLDRRNITITNAWSRVEYEKKTGRSEANTSEIISEENIARLRSELIGVTELVVCCGDKAKISVDACGLSENVKVIFMKHLSIRGLKSIKMDISGAEILPAEAIKSQGDRRTKRRIRNDNTSKRLDVICRSIANQIEGLNVTSQSTRASLRSAGV